MSRPLERSLDLFKDLVPCSFHLLLEVYLPPFAPYSLKGDWLAGTTLVSTSVLYGCQLWWSQWGAPGGDLDGGDLDEGPEVSSGPCGGVSGWLVVSWDTSPFSLPRSCNCSLLQVITALRHCTISVVFLHPTQHFVHSPTIMPSLNYLNFTCRDSWKGRSRNGEWCWWD